MLSLQICSGTDALASLLTLGRAKPEAAATAGGRLVVVRWLGNLHLRRDPPRSTQQPAKH